jgi:hypothetical protein
MFSKKKGMIKMIILRKTREILAMGRGKYAKMITLRR